ncbi:hypothetical protein RUM44_013800 [Polyplax serrata]|uniref:Uncharacterized protein n=1 Tax=Polyplax serrata TaxID=468196 RepID=A0ABR1BIU1_POLSC
MTTTPLLVLFATILTVEVTLTVSHRLITYPYPVNEWNSILVSSNPIRIFERKKNQTGYNLTDNKRNRRARRRSFEECPQNDFKCLYGADDDGNSFPDKYFDRYAESSDLNLEVDLPEKHQAEDEKRKSYWSMLHPQTHHHPYEDKNGWVTLDPVPWSTSKISKWHPNTEIQEAHSPWDHGPTTQRPVHQFWVSGSSYRPQKPQIQWGIGSNDIITDNKPSGFPTGNLNAFPSHGYSQPSYNEYRDPYKKFHQNNGFQVDDYNSRYPPKSHPATYPSQGNGEWVLLSTKKGYSQPNKWSGKASDLTKANDRMSWSRKIKPTEISRYHEEDLKDKKRLLANGKNNTEQNLDEKVMIPLKILLPESEKTENDSTTRKVRLQVLPSSGSTSLTHGGMLEVDSNTQTVNEAIEEANLKKLQNVANIKKNKIRGYKLIPANLATGKSASQRSALTLAAVGAGMIPATMAVLLPMAIERSRRSLNYLQPSYQEYRRNIATDILP